LKDLNPDHILAIYNLKMGDLFLTKENTHGRPPVVGYFEYASGVTKVSVSHITGTTSYFMPIDTGTVGIYFRKNIHTLDSTYWTKFHEVWIGGKKCVIHEHFIDPLPKGNKDG
jgi:hypothetical protein